MSFIAKLRAAAAEAVSQDTDPWRLRLERLRGKIGFDGMERVSTQHLLDVLELPQRERQRAPTGTLQLMTDLGWTAVRVRGLARRIQRTSSGYCRDADYLTSQIEDVNLPTAVGPHHWRHGEKDDD